MLGELVEFFSFLHEGGASSRSLLARRLASFGSRSRQSPEKVPAGRGQRLLKVPAGRGQRLLKVPAGRGQRLSKVQAGRWQRLLKDQAGRWQRLPKVQA